MKQRKSLKIKLIAGIVCVAPVMMQLSGCVAKKIYTQVPTHKKIALKPKNVVVIQYIRTNVQNMKFERLTLTQEEARLERSGGESSFEPITSSFSKEEMVQLAKKAVTFSWKINPVRIRNKLLKEELIIKTPEKEEKVEFEESLAGEFKEFYLELYAIRQTLLKNRK